ncbi:MAG: hypothetical protein FWF77_09825 [Defluviitaleaceae bacterium]|nr:hypothetical protein [Defluviitaleaceae bacterium]
MSLADSFLRTQKKRAKRALETGDMCQGRHIPSKPGAVSRRTKKARQARIGNRGHVSRATHSLEAGSSFPAYKKSAPSALWKPGTCVKGDTFPRSRE